MCAYTYVVSYCECVCVCVVILLCMRVNVYMTSCVCVCVCVCVCEHMNVCVSLSPCVGAHQMLCTLVTRGWAFHHWVLVNSCITCHCCYKSAANLYLTSPLVTMSFVFAVEGLSLSLLNDCGHTCM